MDEVVLVIGNKNYSSWSLRPWLLLRHFGVPFQELRLPLDTDEYARRIGDYSPSGRVPVLVDGSLKVWESLAICEYAGERFPQVQSWPEARQARGLARAISCEMHAGFAALREELPMSCRGRRAGVVPSRAARADIDRIVRIWEECRAASRDDGPWLFGTFTTADAMFAPVALRFHTYDVALPAAAQEYVDTVYAHPALQEWIASAREEREVLPEEDRGTPL